MAYNAILDPRSPKYLSIIPTGNCIYQQSDKYQWGEEDEDVIMKKYEEEKANDFVFLSQMIHNGLVDIIYDNLLEAERSHICSLLCTMSLFIHPCPRQPRHNTLELSLGRIFVHFDPERKRFPPRYNVWIRRCERGNFFPFNLKCRKT